MGVMPSVAFFRHYYYPRVEKGEAMSSGVSFRFRDGLKSEFIVTEDRKIEAEWCTDWCWLYIEEHDEAYTKPTSLPKKSRDWRDRDARDAKLVPICDKIVALRRAGLTDLDVAQSFNARRIAPLQHRTHPVWTYSGEDDRMRLQ